MFTAIATLDARRVKANRINCCFCVPRGCPSCPTVPAEEAAAAVEMRDADPNQMCCCVASAHKGGRIDICLKRHGTTSGEDPCQHRRGCRGVDLLRVLLLADDPLSVEDTQRKFLPDDSYVLSQTEKSDFYFGQLGTSFSVKTVEGDYYASQAALTSIGTRLDKLSYVNPTSGDS